MIYSYLLQLCSNGDVDMYKCESIVFCNVSLFFLSTYQNCFLKSNQPTISGTYQISEYLDMSI